MTAGRYIYYQHIGHLGDSFYFARRDGALLICDYLVRQLAYKEGIPQKQVESCSYSGTVDLEDVSFRTLQVRHVSYRVDDDGRPSAGTLLPFLITTSGGSGSIMREIHVFSRICS